jgi:hypothetical protein
VVGQRLALPVRSDPNRASYPDYYRLLIPPDLRGNYDAPAWTASGIEPWGVQIWLYRLTGAGLGLRLHDTRHGTDRSPARL